MISRARKILGLFFAIVCFAGIAAGASSGPTEKARDHEREADLRWLCPGEEPRKARAISVSKDAEIVLDTGTKLRLADVYLPRTLEKGELAEATAAFLEAGLAGRDISFFETGKPDRYRNVAAHVLIPLDGGGYDWLQRRIVQSGTGAFMPDPLREQPEAGGCDGEEMRKRLLEYDRERLEAVYPEPDPALAIHAADDAGLWRREGHFVIVEGRVLKKYNARQAVLLNFGNNWKDDFTAALSPAAYTFIGNRYKSLLDIKGKRIRLRGFLDLYNGPYMRIDHPLQMELLDD